jgi:hypothetical protein
MMENDSMAQDYLIRLQAGEDGSGSGHLPGAFVDDVVAGVRRMGGQIYFPDATRGDLPIKEIIIAVGSAGVFSGLYQTIAQFLTRNKERELILEHDKTKLVLKGHSLSEEKEILRKLLPELKRADPPKTDAP